MKPRAITRRILRGGLSTVWGPRYTITLEIPKSEFKDPYPLPSPEVEAKLHDFSYNGGVLTRENHDGTGATLHTYLIGGTLGFGGYNAVKAYTGPISKIEEDWWWVNEEKSFTAEDAGWEWLADYASYVEAQTLWVDRNIHSSSWEDPTLRSSWNFLRGLSSRVDFYPCTRKGVETWVVSFFVKTSDPMGVQGLVKQAHRFLRSAKRLHINCHYH